MTDASPADRRARNHRGLLHSRHLTKLVLGKAMRRREGRSGRWNLREKARVGWHDRGGGVGDFYWRWRRGPCAVDWVDKKSSEDEGKGVACSRELVEVFMKEFERRGLGCPPVAVRLEHAGMARHA